MIPERARPWIEAALKADKRPLWTLADVGADLERGEAHLWMGDRSCIVSNFPGVGAVPERVIHVWLAGGAMDEILTVTPWMEAQARAMGCTQVTIEGRKGWVRALAPQGYEYQATIIRKLLT